MKFLRLTSVFLCCALLSSFLILSSSAVDDDNFYSLPPVGGSEPSLAIDWPVSPSSTGDGWTSSDSSLLRDIWQALTDSSSGNAGSIAYCVWWIWNYLKDDIRPALSSIQQNTSASDDRLLTLVTMLGRTNDFIQGGNNILESINTAVSGINGFVKEDSFQSALGNVFLVSGSDAQPSYNTSLARFLGSAFAVTNNGILDSQLSSSFHYNIPYFDPVNKTYNSYWGSWSGIMGQLVSSLGIDAQSANLGYAYTLYHYVKNLSETLASEDDKKLAENYKDNREQAEKDFLNGQSGKTSLGKDDFGSLSSVGGTFKDTISLNGQSSLSDLTSGLSDADTTGQGWFSQATKDSLDAVSGSGSSESVVSTFSDDGLSSVDVDPDPYHMQGFDDNYAWLWGDD